MIPSIWSTLLAAMTPAAALGPMVSAPLSVSATVVRPVDVSSPLTTDEGTAVVVRNSSTVEMRADGGVISNLDQDTTIISASRPGLMVITVIY